MCNFKAEINMFTAWYRRCFGLSAQFFLHNIFLNSFRFCWGLKTDTQQAVNTSFCCTDGSLWGLSTWCWLQPRSPMWPGSTCRNPKCDAEALKWNLNHASQFHSWWLISGWQVALWAFHSVFAFLFFLVTWLLLSLLTVFKAGGGRQTANDPLSFLSVANRQPF